MIKIKNKKQMIKNKGFTLIEVIIAMAVIVAALVSLIALISFSLSGIRPGNSKIIAINLAQEGVEIVRNIRDSNWLANKRTPDTWDDGLDSGQWRIQYNQLGLLSFSNTPLKIDGNGFYQYDTGSNTPFYRKIVIAQIGNNQIKAISEVSWSEKGKSQVIQIEDILYNWLEE